MCAQRSEVTRCTHTPGAGSCRAESGLTGPESEQASVRRGGPRALARQGCLRGTGRSGRCVPRTAAEPQEGPGTGKPSGPGEVTRRLGQGRLWHLPSTCDLRAPSPASQRCEWQGPGCGRSCRTDSVRTEAEMRKGRARSDSGLRQQWLRLDFTWPCCEHVECW